MLTQVIEGRSKNRLTIEFMLGNLCNYKCHYCFPGSHEGDYPWPDVDLLIKNISHLFDTYILQGKNIFELYLVGGEPTLWKDLPKFCTYIKTKYNVIIRISTNGYRNISWWQENSKLFDTVEISVHHEFAKPNHIINVGDILYKNKTNLVANVLMDPYHFDKCVGILDTLKTSKKRWPIVAKWVHFASSQTKYTQDQKKYLKNPLKRFPNLFWWYTLSHKEEYKTWIIENGKKKKVSDNYFILNGKNNFKGWSCNLGIDHIHIHQTGRIAGSCGEFIYGIDDYYNLYAKDFTTKFQPTIRPVTCTKEFCGCGFETNISKVISIKSV